MSSAAKLLSPPHNFAVVQLPERQYPGVVIQGDSLNGLVGELSALKQALSDGELQEARDVVEELVNLYSGVLQAYVATCERTGTGVPFPVERN